ncbi:hypothetical protein BN961_02537 [Afipia felis]|uniref:DUF2798 domain-containing protein n=1 Tax=Afipia felis TaxID=1035 RepID=A0A090MP02_AFIFE|nr:conserved hypothetical protein [Afipia sp. 1NLS2]CEG09116.1 hypothetical protein BN961_02537 [Afipia felis]
MLLPRKYGHFIFGVLQSGITSGVATGLATYSYHVERLFQHWLLAWLTSWALMIPLVLFAAPAVQRLTFLLTCNDS